MLHRCSVPSLPSRLAAHVLGLAIWLGLSTSAFAQPGWTPPVPLAGSALPRVGIDAAGNAVAVWLDATGLRAADYAASVDAWSPVVSLVPPGDRIVSPSVVMTDGGRAMAAWTNRGPVGTTWSPAA